MNLVKQRMWTARYFRFIESEQKREREREKQSANEQPKKQGCARHTCPCVLCSISPPTCRRWWRVDGIGEEEEIEIERQSVVEVEEAKRKETTSRTREVKRMFSFSRLVVNHCKQKAGLPIIRKAGRHSLHSTSIFFTSFSLLLTRIYEFT